jgi:hypothetical protein
MKISGCLRILVVISTPGDLSRLDAAEERIRIEWATRALRQEGLMELELLDGVDANVDMLQQRLQDARAWHGFHFIGHGDYDSVGGGRVAFTNADNSVNWLSAHDLGLLLADHLGLRFALLNCCRGADDVGVNVFASTAAAIAQAGLPAVIAMHRVVSDQSAIRFADQFYRALANGLPVDAAVAEGRKAIAIGIDGLGALDWLVPILYMRGNDGELFDAKGVAELADVPGRLDPGQSNINSSISDDAHAMTSLYSTSTTLTPALPETVGDAIREPYQHDAPIVPVKAVCTDRAHAQSSSEDMLRIAIPEVSQDAANESRQPEGPALAAKTDEISCAAACSVPLKSRHSRARDSDCSSVWVSGAPTRLRAAGVRCSSSAAPVPHGAVLAQGGRLALRSARVGRHV